MTRKEQLAHTRERLLDATVECLVTYGYAGTTTQRIQDAAGLSRGALLHHFGSKSELLVAAIHHVADQRFAMISSTLEELEDGPGSLRLLVEAIREAMTGPYFQAALELWSASRTDEQLRAALLPAERRLGSALRDLFRRHAGIEDPDEEALAFESLMALVRGLEVTRNMRSTSDMADRVVAAWLDSVERVRRA
ncbi:TetR/AcrR family transcriptional regulator [Aeromicrobium tamlense]|nr:MULTISPECIES: TetR/AcrR family transcriptional regulator [Aeromicrobium]MBD1272081.1 TetR/AcrR family transcriptional regulator [Aeromicrobium tamlense]